MDISLAFVLRASPIDVQVPRGPVGGMRSSEDTKPDARFQTFSEITEMRTIEFVSFRAAVTRCPWLAAARLTGSPAHSASRRVASTWSAFSTPPPTERSCAWAVGTFHAPSHDRLLRRALDATAGDGHRRLTRSGGQHTQKAAGASNGQGTNDIASSRSEAVVLQHGDGLVSKR